MKKIKNIILIGLMFISSFYYNPNINLNVNASNIPIIEMNDAGTDLKNGTIGGKDYGLAYTDAEAQKATPALNKILKEYRGIVVFISGIALISMIMFFIFNFIELGNSRGNPQARQKAVHGLIVSGIATAGLGSVTLIVQLFYNMISE